MSSTRTPTYDTVIAGGIQMIPPMTQLIVTEVLIVEVGAVLDVQGKLVVMP